ncbi:MAG: DUF2076 domain-containing protein [Alphaproteobacteria bacterium]|nr:DUF2076 domain-containing protein [Alphaproteobacteria bacterium]
MTPQERDLITDLFRRLRAADAGPRDREADDLIGRLTAEHPDAPYLLAQTVLVQQQALSAASARVEELERELAQAKTQSAGTGSFLGGACGVFGPWGGRPAAVPQSAPFPTLQPGYAAPPAAGPWGAAPGGTGGGGGFLRSAMTTAAGVAGGALLFEGIQHLLGSNPGPFAQTAAPPTEVVENTTVNNYYGDQTIDDPVVEDTGDTYYDDV